MDSRPRGELLVLEYSINVILMVLPAAQTLRSRIPRCRDARTGFADLFRKPHAYLFLASFWHS